MSGPHRWKPVAGAALAIALGVMWVAPATGAELPEFPPGKETKVEDASIGGDGYYLVYVPKEYTPEAKWPLVVCYHGMNGKATTWPFKNVLGGKRCIIVGMEYYKRGSGGFGHVGKDAATVKRILPDLVKQLSIDTKQLFIGGFSKGGFMTSSIAEQTLPLWTGILVLGAGRHGSGGAARDTYRGKAVYVGVGEKDEFHKGAEAAAASYRRLGANVTFEVYEGLGHAVNAKSEVMRDWFLANTEFRHVEPAIAKAREFVKRKKLGLAYAELMKAAAASDTFGLCKQAAKEAQALADQFETRFAEAEQAAGNGQYPRAADILRKLSREFAGSELGERAKKRLPELMQESKKPR